MDELQQRDRDLVLPPNTFAYVLDSTKGKVSIYVGPYKNSLSNTDQLVVWDKTRRQFVPVNDLDRATSVFQVASEGQYVVLDNPTADGGHPPKGNSTESLDLEVGRKVNVPGPASFPLWPGQIAATLDGHHLRHNQYLIVRVYDAESARDNYDSAVVAPQSGSDEPATSAAPTAFTMGQLAVIKGTDVSFYIPPTGIEVVPEDGDYVRDAVTLETLEYCVLLDENGSKRYVRGPDVVFPLPTERFVTESGNRKFKAIELNPHSGVYVKVIAEYADDSAHAVGEELFITGTDDAIYFPRAEHSIIKYGDKLVHFATAIPAGEGRYVLDRDAGTVDLIVGPKMFLPDPRRQVIVLRVLDSRIVNLLYPGNIEALDVNEHYRDLSSADERLSSMSLLSNVAVASAYSSAQADELSATPASTRHARSLGLGDTTTRGTGYTPPRSVVLDTKYEGAVMVNVWPGYAILVTDKVGNRRVVLGPKPVLLQYDETLMPLRLSQGKPKSEETTLETPYLRVISNRVSDRMTVETADLVTLTVDVAYRVHFEADTPEEQERWFAVENYVRLLTHHLRSRVRNLAKKHGIQEFYLDAITLIRDEVLGESVDGSRPGLRFAENGMRVYDVEVTRVAIENTDTASLLLTAQRDALSGAIQLSQAEVQTQRTARLEELRRATLAEQETSRELEAVQLAARGQRDLELRLAQEDGALHHAEARLRTAISMLEADRAHVEQDQELTHAANAIELERLTAETTEHIRRLEAISPELTAALARIGDTSFIETLITGLGPAALASGVTTAEMFARIFKDTPFAGALEALADRPLALTPNGQGG